MSSLERKIRRRQMKIMHRQLGHELHLAKLSHDGKYRLPDGQIAGRKIPFSIFAKRVAASEEQSRKAKLEARKVLEEAEKKDRETVEWKDE